MGGGGPSCDVLVVGMPKSGKTSLVRQLKACTLPCEAPRSGLGPEPMSEVSLKTIDTFVELTEVRVVGGRTLVLREVGGVMVTLWPEYTHDCRCVCFVVDAGGDRRWVDDAAEEFDKILGDPDLQDVPVAVFFNKVEAGARVPGAELARRFFVAERIRADQVRVAAGRRPRLGFMEGSAVTGEGVQDLLAWAIDRLGYAPAATPRAIP